MAWILFCLFNYMRLNSFLGHCVKMGYAGQSATVTDMFSEADYVLFRKILYNKTHLIDIYLIG